MRLEEVSLLSNQPPHLPNLCAGDHPGHAADEGAGNRQRRAWALPLPEEAADRRAFGRHQAIDRIADHAAPAGAAVFTAAVNVDARLALQLERPEDRRVLSFPQLVSRDALCTEILARLEQLGRAQKTADVVGSVC